MQLVLQQMNVLFGIYLLCKSINPFGAILGLLNPKLFNLLRAYFEIITKCHPLSESKLVNLIKYFMYEMTDWLNDWMYCMDFKVIEKLPFSHTERNLLFVQMNFEFERAKSSNYTDIN